MSTLMKVMTFNMRFHTVTDGKNSFENRKNRILAVLQSEKPDIIGFQEVTEGMLAWLRDVMPEYYILGHGRNASYRGEGVPIAYRKDCFELHSFRQEWLSLYPEQPKSVLDGLDQSLCPRTYCCAELIHKNAKSPIAFYNIHTDHKGSMARIAECTILLRDLVRSPYRFVLTGDFNACPDTPEIAMIHATAATLGTVDATASIKGSFHNFRGDVGTCKIDYIFTNLARHGQAYAVADDGVDGCYYSDHHAICTLVEL